MTRIATRPDSSQPAAEMAVDLFENMGVELFVVRPRRIVDEIPQRPILPQPVLVPIPPLSAQQLAKFYQQST